ncbi:MAG: anthranilate phosphoribosyltransferase [Thermoplasmata archaeon]
MIRDAIGLVVEGKDLDSQTAMQVMREIMAGVATPAQMGSFITAMRMKGETVAELTGFAMAMRESCAKIRSPPGAVDLCGTGGDGLNTFNISTVASFVVAAAGVPVAKHGNRSVSSRSGSADLLAALGFPVDLDPKSVERILGAVGIGFMFAPIFHSSMRNVAGARRELGIRTYFNILGPLTNPASVENQLIGVYDPDLAEKMARVLMELGSNHVFIVHSNGMDEASIADDTRVVELRDGKIENFFIRPEMFGFERASLEELKGGTPEDNARIALSILSGERSPRRDVVALNAGLAICASGRAESLREGVEIACDMIDGGLALKKAKEYSKAVMAVEVERQRTSDVKALLDRRIQMDVMQERCSEICRELLARCEEEEKARELLGMLDEEIIRVPTPLSILALNRIFKLGSAEKKDIVPHACSGTRFSESLRFSEGISLIAEYKPRSPTSSPMVLPPSTDSVIDAYRSFGLSAVSVLVEPDYFGGSIQLFSYFRSRLDVPLLFKDFVISNEQLDIARSIGADAVLLIAKLLNKASLESLIDDCCRKGLEPLVELHDEKDIAKFQALSAKDKVDVIGLNSRDFASMKTNLERIRQLQKLLPDDKLVVAESGVGSSEDLKLLRDFDAVLIGSLFMKAQDIRTKLSEIIAACRSVSA